MIHINYKSDFQTKVNIKDKDGNIIAPPSVPWEVVFADEQGKEFICKHNGGIYTHCLVDGNDIVCFINNPCFCVGKLRCSFVQHIPSGEYCDGTLDLTQPLSCDIMLWKRESDNHEDITLETTPNWVKGDKGEQGIQGEKGDKGDKGDKGEKGADGRDGRDGAKGEQGEQGIRGERGKDGVNGIDGEDGFSPIVQTSKVGKVTTITITDANGTHTAQINDGEDGKGSEIDAYTKDEADEKFVSRESLSDEIVTDSLEADSAVIREVNTDGVFFEKTSIYEEDGKLTNNGDEILTTANNPQEVYVGDGTPTSDAKIAIDPSEDLVEIVQEVGTATDKVMSQDAVTKALANIPSGGGSIWRWEHLADVDVSQTLSNNITFDNLNGAVGILFRYENLISSTTSASAIAFGVNNGGTTFVGWNGFIRISANNNTNGFSGWAMAKYNGLYWELPHIGGANSPANSSEANLYEYYNIRSERMSQGVANSFTLYPNPSHYPSSGTIKIYIAYEK